MTKLCELCHTSFEALRSAKYCSFICSHTMKKEANAAYMRRWSETNHDEKLERDRAYKQAHRKELNQKQLKYQKEHYDRIKIEKRLWKRAEYHKKREILKARRKAQYWTNPEKVRQQARQYAKKHPEAARANAKSRRARLLNAPLNDFSAMQWEEMKTVFSHCCAYCNQHFDALTMDHITPLTQGGSHTLHNIVPACRSCNAKKKTAGAPLPVQPLLLTCTRPKKIKPH